MWCMFNYFPSIFKKINSAVHLYQDIFKRNLPQKNIFVNCDMIGYKKSSVLTRNCTVNLSEYLCVKIPDKYKVL